MKRQVIKEARTEERRGSSGLGEVRENGRTDGERRNEPGRSRGNAVRKGT